MGFNYSSKLYGAGGATIGDNGFVYNPVTDTLTVGTLNANNVTATALATPGAITVTNQGTPGGTTVTYKLVALLADGTTTEAGAASSTATSNATLSATNFNRLAWSAVTGATSYRVYRTVAPTTPNTTGIIYSGTALTVDDTGLAGGGETAPTTNGTGIVQAQRVLVGDGTAAAPSVAFASAPTSGLHYGSNTLFINLVGNTVVQAGASFFDLNADTAGLRLRAAHDTLITSPAAATLQLGAANVTGATPPVAQTLKVQGVGTTATADLAGADWTHIGSLGKGTAASGKMIFQVGTPQNTTVAHVASTALTLQDTGTAGTAAPQALFPNGVVAKPSISFAAATDTGIYFSTGLLSLVYGGTDRFGVTASGAQVAGSFAPTTSDTRALGGSSSMWQTFYLSRATLGSKTKTLTESSATGFVDIAVTAGQRISGEVIYEVYAADATDFQTITGRLRYAAVNKGGTTTVTVSEVGTQTTAVSAGTLTATNTAADTTNKVTLSCNAVSSLTQTTLEIRYRLDSVSTNTITPL